MPPGEGSGGGGGGGVVWAEADCLVLSFAARDFAPHQVRRMAATIAAVVSGLLDDTFIDQCFDLGDRVVRWLVWGEPWRHVA